MKSNDFLNENIVSDAHEMHLDHEVQMARQECYHAAEDAITLHKLLRHMGEQQGLEGWVSAKITLAADYLNTVREHLEYQLMSGASEEPVEVVAIAENVITAEDLGPVDEGVGSDVAKLGGIAALGIGGALVGNYADQQQPKVEIGGKIAFVEPAHSRVPDSAMTLTGKDGKTYRVWATKGTAQSQQRYHAVPVEGVKEGEVYDLEKEYGYEKPKAQPKKASVAPTRPSLHPEDTDFMDPVERRLRADRERVKAAWAAHNAKKGVAESSENGYYYLQGGIEQSNKFASAEEAEKQVVAFGNEARVPKVTLRFKAPGAPSKTVKTFSINNEQVSENAGSVATVVNPTPKNKAKVGTLFGGTYKQKKAAK